jgi:hypothetical protein
MTCNNTSREDEKAEIGAQSCHQTTRTLLKADFRRHKLFLKLMNNAVRCEQEKLTMKENQQKDIPQSGNVVSTLQVQPSGPKQRELKSKVVFLNLPFVFGKQFLSAENAIKKDKTPSSEEKFQQKTRRLEFGFLVKENFPSFWIVRI